MAAITDIFNMAAITEYGETQNFILIKLPYEKSEQTMQTQIRLLLQEQSDQGLHCLPFHLHFLDALDYIIKPKVKDSHLDCNFKCLNLYNFYNIQYVFFFFFLVVDLEILMY